MTKALIILDPDASVSDRDAVIQGIDSSGAALAALFDPHLAIVEGDDTALLILSGSIGNGLLALDQDGSTNVASLGLPPELEVMVGLWTLTFDGAVQAAQANRFRDGEEWEFLSNCKVP